MSRKFTYGSLTALAAIAVLTCGSAQAQQLAFSAPVQSRVAPAHPNFDADIGNEDATLAPRLQRQVVDYPSREAAGTIIVDTAHTYLYLVLGHGKALRYGIGFRREGFPWSGVKSVQRKVVWPVWFLPAAVIAFQPYVPSMTS